MKAYKGFNRDLKCRGFQYEIGKEYEEKDAKLCKRGFHACENPLDVLRYYPPSGSRFCEVELDEISPKRGGDSKVVGKKIRIETEIGLAGIINAGVQFIAKKAENNYKKVANTGDCSVATNTGDYSVATNTGDCSATSVTGKDSIAIVTGNKSRAKGALGCWIVLTERGIWNGETYPIKNVQAFCVDGDKVKADTFYKLKDGELVKVGND